MTIQEFDQLTEGARIDSRMASYGDGVVERNGEVLVIRWADGSVSWALNILRGLWGTWDAAPMKNWIVL